MSINLARIFANALARRVAYVVVAAIIGLFAASGKAQAQTYHTLACVNASPTSARPCTQGPAFSECQAVIASARSRYNHAAGAYVCKIVTGGNGLIRTTIPANETQVNFLGYPGAFYYRPTETCSSTPSQTTTRLPLPGSKQCINGCMMTYMTNADNETSTRSPNGSVCSNTKDNCGTGFFYNVLMNVCQPIAPQCKEGEVSKNGVCEREADCPDGMVAAQPGTAGAIAAGELYCKPAESECPAGNIKAPSGECLPGENQCAAGEAKKKDGTCGKDSDNDGTADDDDEDDENDTTKPEFSGGDSCKSPPTCNGNPILCGQARIQWRIECNTRKNRNVSGGNCAAPPVCSGEKCDAVESNQLTMQWRTACAVEKLSKAGGGTGGESDGVVDYLTAQRDAEIAAANANASQGDGHEGVSEDSIFATNDGEQFNPNLFGGSSPGMCSFSTELELMGHPITLPGEFWTLAAMIGWLTVACAYLWVAFQLS